MFNPDIVERFAKAHEDAFLLLRSIESSLQKRFWEMHDPILALLLSVASNEPLLLIGKPGTAKSRLIRAFCETVGLIDERDNTKNGPLTDYFGRIEKIEDATGYFEYLLTPFTEPNELFGFYDIERLVKTGTGVSNGKLERIEKGMMQKAYVVYLDEVFNASSAILNSLLSFLNERIFHDRGERKRVLYKALFAATNRVPESGELAAVYDRFLLRCRVDNVKADPTTIKSLFETGWPETYSRSEDGETHDSRVYRADRELLTKPTPIPPKNFNVYKNLFEELKQLRNSLSANASKNLAPNPAYVRQKEENFYPQLIKNINIARTGGFSEMSNRRMIKMLYVMLIHCMYRSINQPEIKPLFELGNPEIELMPKFFYDRAYEPLIWK